MDSNNSTAIASSASSPNAKPMSAPPPFSAIGVVLCVTVFSLRGMPSWKEIDAVATVEAFTTPVLPSLLSTRSIGIIRCLIACFMLGAITMRMLGPGSEIFQVPNPSKSKLKPWKMRMCGILILATFTYWSFLLLGLYFLASGIICLISSFGLLDGNGDNEHLINSFLIPWLLRFSLLSFEISAPGAFLVSTVVRYGLWPAALKSRGPDGTILFRSFMGLVTHNVTVLFVLTEICFLGGTPVLMNHMAVGPVMVILYILFSWYMMNRWQPGTGPRFIYFFLDTTVPKYECAIALFVLVTVLMGFYIMVAQMYLLLESYLDDATVLPRILITVGLSSAVCRFRN